MSRSENTRRQHHNRELWGGRPLDGYKQNGENKRMARQIERARAKAAIKKEQSHEEMH